MKNASKKTMLERYGVTRAMQSKDIKRKHQQTITERHGVAYPRQIHFSKETKRILFNEDNFIAFIQDKVFNYILKQLEISAPTLTSYAENTVCKSPGLAQILNLNGHISYIIEC